MCGIAAVEKQGNIGREGEGDCRSSPAAHGCLLRRERRDRAQISASGRNWDTVRHYGRFRNPGRKRRGSPRYRHLARTRFDETGTRRDQRFGEYFGFAYSLIYGG